MGNNIFKLSWRVANFFIFIQKTSLTLRDTYLALLWIKRSQTSFPIMEDFDSDRWRRTPAADTAYKQEELTGPQQVEREVWSIMAAWQSDAPPRYSHTSVTAWEHRGRPRAPNNTCLSAGGNFCHLSSDLWNFGLRWEQRAK